MTLGGLHLRRRGVDLLLAADALQRLQMLLRGIERRLRLRVGDLGVVHEFLRERAILEQLLAVVEQPLCGVHRFVRRGDVGLRLGHLLGHARGGRRSVVGLRLVVLAAALLRRGGEVARLELGQQLSLLHVIAAVHEEALHRRADLRHDVGLVAWVEHGVRVHDQADAPLDGGGDADRRHDLGRRVRLLAADQRDTHEHAAGE